MTTDEMMVDVSQDWMLACDVQQGLCGYRGWLTIPGTIAPAAVKFGRSAAIATISYP